MNPPRFVRGPTVRGSWSAYAIEGWYVGPALDSYRCFCIWIDDARSTRAVKHVTWFPAHLRQPLPTSINLLRDTLDHLGTVLSASSLAAFIVWMPPKPLAILSRPCGSLSPTMTTKRLSMPLPTLLRGCPTTLGSNATLCRDEIIYRCGLYAES